LRRFLQGSLWLSGQIRFTFLAFSIGSWLEELQARVF
jgi:hypothetical protein